MTAALPSIYRATNDAAPSGDGAKMASAPLTQVSAGVHMVRGGQSMAARTGGKLQMGGTIVAPAGGNAQAVMTHNDGQSQIAPLAASTEATLGNCDSSGAAGVAAFTAASGSVETVPAAANAAAVPTAKAEAADSNTEAGGAVLGDFLLASLVGVGGGVLAGALLNSGNDGDDSTPTNPGGGTEEPGMTAPTGTTDPTDHGLITSVQDLVDSVLGSTVASPVGNLIDTLLNPSTGTLAAVTGLLEGLTSVDGGHLGVLAELVNGLTLIDGLVLEPVIGTLNQLIAGLSDLGSGVGSGGLGGLLDSFITVTTSTAEALADLQPLSLAISSHVSEAGTVGISGAISQELQHHSLTL